MNKTIFKSNFEKLEKVLGFPVDYLKQEISYHFKAEGFMDLVVEKISDCEISLAHYYKQNGDPMRDPEMVVKVYTEQKEVEAVMFQQDNLGLYQEVYRVIDGRKMVSVRLKKELNDFLGTWLGNLILQGHKIYK